MFSLRRDDTPLRLGITLLLLACLLSSILHYTTDDLSDILLLLRQQISCCQPYMRIKPAALFIFVLRLFPFFTALPPPPPF